MKYSEVVQYLHNTNPDEIQVDFTSAIIHDEFNRRHPAGERHDFREDALNRLIRYRLPWRAEMNLAGEVAKRYIGVTCPYCGKPMNWVSYHGTSSNMYCEYRCECGAKAIIPVLDAEFEPGSREMDRTAHQGEAEGGKE